MYTKGNNWEAVEDVIIKKIDAQYSHLTIAEVTDIIKELRPHGIKPSRYTGTSLYQHVRLLRAETKRTA